MKFFLAALFLSGTLAMATTAQEQRVSASVTTQGFVGLKTRYEYGIGHERYAGAFYHVSALMLVQEDFDTGELGVSITGTLPFGKLSFDGLVEAGYRFQNQSTGLARTAFVNALAGANLKLGIVSPGLEVGWDQAIVTGIVYSDFARERFEDIYDGSPAPPAGSILFLPSGRLKTGLFCGIMVSDRLDLAFAGGILYTPNPFVSGFDGMAFGFFPFYADLRFRVTVR